MPTLELMPPIPVTGTFHQAKQLLDKKLTYLRTMLKKFRDKRYAIMNRNTRSSMVIPVDNLFTCSFLDTVSYTQVTENLLVSL